MKMQWLKYFLLSYLVMFGGVQLVCLITQFRFKLEVFGVPLVLLGAVAFATAKVSKDLRVHLCIISVAFCSLHMAIEIA